MPELPDVPDIPSTPDVPLLPDVPPPPVPFSTHIALSAVLSTHIKYLSVVLFTHNVPTSYVSSDGVGSINVSTILSYNKFISSTSTREPRFQ